MIISISLFWGQFTGLEWNVCLGDFGMHLEQENLYARYMTVRSLCEELRWVGI